MGKKKDVKSQKNFESMITLLILAAIIIAVLIAVYFFHH